MAKPEWGSKRVCLSCGARFYDMNRDADRLPGLRDGVRSGGQQQAATFADAGEGAGRRGRGGRPRPSAIEPDEVEGDDDEVAVSPTTRTRRGGGESAIEDVSELGDDDMSDVIDADIDEDDGER